MVVLSLLVGILSLLALMLALICFRKCFAILGSQGNKEINLSEQEMQKSYANYKKFQYLEQMALIKMVELKRSSPTELQIDYRLS